MNFFDLQLHFLPPLFHRLPRRSHSSLSFFLGCSLAFVSLTFKFFPQLDRKERALSTCLFR